MNGKNFENSVPADGAQLKITHRPLKIPSFQLVYKSCYLGKLFSHKELRQKHYIKLFPSSLMNIFKYPVNEPCKQKQDPVCYTCSRALTHLSCPPNFPHASYLDERTLIYEPIVKEYKGGRIRENCNLKSKTGRDFLPLQEPSWPF